MLFSWGRDLLKILLSQIGGSTIFTAVGSYIARMSPLNCLMVTSIFIVLVGTVLACAHDLLRELSSTSIDLNYLFGVGMALLATLSIALRNVMEEIVFADYKMDPLQFSATYGLFGTSLIGIILLSAQFIPGRDNGVQVPRPDAPTLRSP